MLVITASVNSQKNYVLFILCISSINIWCNILTLRYIICDINQLLHVSVTKCHYQYVITTKLLQRTCQPAYICFIDSLRMAFRCCNIQQLIYWSRNKVHVKINPKAMYVCIYRLQNVVLRCPTPRLHCFLSSHWPSFRFLSFMAFLIPSNQFFFGLPRALFCFGIHFSAILGNLSSVNFEHGRTM